MSRRGPGGLPGSSGNGWLTTSGAPSNGTGSNGDYAFDPATQIFYGPKAAGSWPAGVQAQGATSVDSVNPPPDLLDWAVNGQTTAIDRYTNGSAYTVGTEWGVYQKVAGVVRRVLGLKTRLVVSGTETHALSLWKFDGTLHETKNVTASANGEYAITFDVPFQPLLNAPFRVGCCNLTNPTYYSRISTPSANRDLNTAIVSGGVRVTAANYYALGASTRPTTASGSERYLTVPDFEDL